MIRIKIDSELQKTIEAKHLKDTYLQMVKWFRVENAFNKTTLSDDAIKEILIGDRRNIEKWIVFFGKNYPHHKWNNINLPYERFRNRKWAINLLESLNVRVCPYCDRQYTITVAKVKISPHFDHFYPKSKYPFLQLSLFNLIPSCSTCNLKKGDKDPYRSGDCDIFYPYEESASIDLYFQTKLNRERDFRYWLGFNESSFTVALKAKNKQLIKKKSGINDTFGIEEVYNYHSDYVLDIIKKMNVYTHVKQRELINSFPELFNDESSFQRLFFMNELNEEDWGNRPLSKLAKDIFNEFS